MTIKLRPATPDDAKDMAVLADIAGEGLPSSIWNAMAYSGETALDVGARRAVRPDAVFSWKNAVMAVIDGETAGMMMSYVTAAEPEPLSEDMHPVMRPLLKLENQALETRYINILATYDSYRRKGVAHCLMEEAECMPGKNGMSLITTDRNARGREFYEALGYRDVAQAPVIKTNWDTPSETWHLLRKP